MNSSNPPGPGSVIAQAKINLGLEVLYERPDRYHEINTLFLRVAEPHDTITITHAGYFRLTCSDESLPVDNSNLMILAAHEYEHATGKPLPPLLLHLEKQIPMGAGLGGGSSDAAAMLQILRDYSIPRGIIEHVSPPTLSEEAEFKLAAKIGADVPFFLSGFNAAAARGIGEELTPVNVRVPGSILIVADPSTPVSTAEAYASLAPEVKSPRVDYVKFFKTPPALRAWKENLFNDFEPGVFRRYPRLAEIKHALYVRGAGFALLSGSGSALFGIFEEIDAARKAKQVFEMEGLKAFLSES